MSSAFRHAPVSKFLVPVLGGYSTLIAIFPIESDSSQLWRVVSSPWGFNSLGTAVVGTWLIYKLRIIERRLGSAKYAALIFTSFVASTLLQTSVLLVSSRFGMKSMSNGPYAILFSILYQFYRLIPPTDEFRFLGITMTDKTYVYMAATKLLLGDGVSSMIPCLCGWVTGWMYDANIKDIKEWRFPTWMRKVTSKYILPILSSRSTVTQRQSAHVNVDDENINTMISMFPHSSRENIKSALIQSHQDLNRAAEILINEQMY
ncbi:hypothetical protein BDB01DRAFT_800949 [Pilobolus umbonatus]|nr:hypothetical protein BDB01DRAFT_800949 [Pilobolus umbonatus]